MRNRVLACLAALAALALAGCGAAERIVERATEKVVESAAENIVERAVESATGISVDAGNGSITFTGADGETLTLSAEGAEGELVAGFPLPVYGGAKVVNSGRVTANGKTTFSAELSFTADAIAVADFYEQELEALGIEVSRSEMEIDGETMVMLAGESDTQASLITITRKAAEQTGTANLLIGDR